MPEPPPISEQDLAAALATTAEVLEQRGVKYAVIGGMATGYRSQPRFTKDVDFLLHVPQVSLPPLLEDLQKRGFDFDLLPTIREWTQHHMAVLSYRGIRIDWLDPVIPAYHHVLDRASDALLTTHHHYSPRAMPHWAMRGSAVLASATRMKRPGRRALGYASLDLLHGVVRLRGVAMKAIQNSGARVCLTPLALACLLVPACQNYSVPNGAPASPNTVSPASANVTRCDIDMAASYYYPTEYRQTIGDRASSGQHRPQRHRRADGNPLQCHSL
jgi:hypothetical protein